MHLRYARQPDQALHVLGPHAAARHDADAPARLPDQRCNGVAALCIRTIFSKSCFCSSIGTASLPFTGSMPRSLRPEGCVAALCIRIIVSMICFCSSVGIASLPSQAQCLGV